MLGDMPSVRAAAEKPLLSTTFTKVAMLVMRSMRSPDHAVRLPVMFRGFGLIKPPAITFAHIFGRRECGRPGGPQLGRIVSEQANPDLRDVLRRRSLSHREHHHLRHSACVPRTSTSTARADAAALSPHAAASGRWPSCVNAA